MIRIEPMINLPDFYPYEFDCKCGCGLNNMKPIFLWKLQQCRTEARVKFIITSGCRCKKHNKNVGGRGISEHLTGEAADILTPNSHIRYKVLKAAFAVGFTRIGIGATYIHLGDKHNYPQQVVWDYYRKT